MATTDTMTDRTATYMAWCARSRHEGVPCVEHYPIENWSTESLRGAVRAFYAEINVLNNRLANCDAKLVEASRLNADAVAQADVLRNQNGQYRDMLGEVKFAIDGFGQGDDE